MLRITSTYRSVQGAKYKILVYDREFSGDEVEMDTYAEVLTHEGNPDDPFKRISPVRFSFTMVLNSTNYDETTRESVVAFYLDLISAYEGRFYITVRQNTLSGTILFRGKIIADIGDLQLNFYKDVKITAIDGLTSLKDIEFRPTDYTDLVAEYAIKLSTFVEIFTDLLMRTDVNQFFYVDTSLNATGDVLFSTANNWTETNSDAGDIWAQVKKRNTWFEQKSETYRKYKNGWDVYNIVLTGYNARIIFSDGVYHIEQIGYLDNLTLSRRKYNFEGNDAGSYANKTTINITTDDNCHILAHPSVKQLPAFKAVELKQSKAFTNYINGVQISYDYNPGPHNFGYVIGTGSRLVFDWRFSLLYLPDINLAFKLIRFEFQIKIGDYYLKSLSTGYQNTDQLEINTGSSQLKLLSYELTLVPSTCVMLLNPNASWVNMATFFHWSIVGESTVIPEDGELIIELIAFNVVDVTLTDVPAETAKLVRWTITKHSRVIISPTGYGGLAQVPEGLSIYEVGDVKNTIIYPIEFDYYDGDFSEFHSLYIDQDTVTVATEEWTDDDMGETLPIQQLVMKQILGMRSKPTQVINCILQRSDDGIMTADMRFASGDELYMPLKFEHNLSEGTYSIALYKIFKDYAGINIVDTGTPDIYNDFPTPSGLESGITPNSGIKYFYREFVASGTYVTIPDSLPYFVSGDTSVDTIRSDWSVYAEGVFQDYVDYTTLTFPLTGGELAIGQYTMEPAENRFHFAFLENQTIIIKYLRI